MNRLSRGTAALLRAAAAVASRHGKSGALLVLKYHRVLATPDPLLADEPDAAEFAAQMDLVRDLCRVLSLSEAVDRLSAGSLPSRAVAITFDDGYANNLEVAAPILASRGIPATVFVTTGFIAGGQMWNDEIAEALRVAPPRFDLSELGLGVFDLAGTKSRRDAVERILTALKYRDAPERIRAARTIAGRAGLAGAPQPMMSESQLRRLAGFGIDVGAHCITHPILARVPADVAKREIVQGKRDLEDILGAPVTTFAYPNGEPGTDYGPEHVAMIRDAGFKGAVSTAWGAADRRTDPYQIPRISPWDRTPERFALRVVRGYLQRRPRAV